MYNLLHLQVNRGTYNSQAHSGDAVSVEHSYKADQDNIATVETPGYFPDNFGLGDSQNIQIGDTLVISASDGMSNVKIIGLSPVVLESSGDNTFPNGIYTNDIFLLNIGGNLNLIPNANSTDAVIVGNSFASKIDVQEVDSLFPGNPMLIGENANDIKIGQTSGTTTFNGDIKLLNGLGTLNYLNFLTTTLTFTGAFAAPQVTAVTAQKINNMVTITFNALSGAFGSAGTVFSTTVLPAAFRPAISTTYFVIGVIDNAIPVEGSCVIDSAGNVTVYKGFNGTFAGPGNIGFATFSITYKS